MKVDMDRLMDTMPKKKTGRKRHGWLKQAATLVLCLTVLGTAVFYESIGDSRKVSADELYGNAYDESFVNPSFTVQHMGEVQVMDIQPGEGTVPVFTGDQELSHTSLDETGAFVTTVTQETLYADYETSWREKNSLSELSFLSGSEYYRLKEIWFGSDKTSENPSDFLILKTPDDLSKVTLTNNREHPGLSAAVGGYYEPDGDGNYTVCIHDGDVVRLMFEATEGQDTGDVNVFDYDVTDGGYYLEADADAEKELKPTSGRAAEKKRTYLDAREKGIHTAGSGDGAAFAFGSDRIPTGLENEARDGGLDTINVHNFSEKSPGLGVSTGLVSGIMANGDIRWADGIKGLPLFGKGSVPGRTAYTDGEYTFGFVRNGFTKTLSSVSSTYSMDLQGLEKTGVPFWILNNAPSYDTDGHDPVWANEQQVSFYTDTEPAPFIGGDAHSRFFGFSYTEDFTLSPGYVGPLSVFGYVDDDLWVFAAQVDEKGYVLPDTAVQLVDLGGVHDPAGYFCNLWEKFSPVAYGEEAQHWRLFVYWLERDGEHADCCLSMTLPDEASVSTHREGSTVVEASRFDQEDGRVRTFLFNNGTHDSYKGTFADGSNTIITSGVAFVIPDGSLINIEGLPDAGAFTIQEIGAAKTWASNGDGYTETQTVEGIVGEMTWTSFLSAPNPGTLSVKVDADAEPENGYHIKLSLPDMGSVEVSAMDGHGNPIGSRFLDENGDLPLTLAANETLVLYNLPEGISYTLTAETPAGMHLSDIQADGSIMDNGTVSGVAPGSVVYQYEANEPAGPQIAIEQSVGNDWGTSEILLGTGALLSYRVTVTNINASPIDVQVEDLLPDGLELLESSLGDGQADGQTAIWDLKVGAFSSVERSFTCRVIQDEGRIDNQMQIITDGEMTVSNTVSAVIP